MILESIGGLGLFLLGMTVMTGGLRDLAGDALRHGLIRFTRSPVSGAATGAACTALLQSSSATTVAVIGFVAAGLMSFPAALGIVFGANIGTTLTGWMVALLGFKLKLGAIATLIVFVGAVLRLFGGGRLGSAGQALAGFGLIFVGIATMQAGMAELREEIPVAGLPGDGLGGRLLLVGIGIAFTVIAQSSSAGVAAALTALHTGLIDFAQAAALVIGMDVGTTVTAGIATIGATTGARRTGASHIVFNLMTGVGALLLLPLYTLVAEAVSPGWILANAELALVGFHTTFNAIGVLAVLPFVRPFARMMERLIPGEAPAYTTGLDPALLGDDELAITAAMRSTRLEFESLLGHVNAVLGDERTGRRVNLPELQTALDETHQYLERVAEPGGDAETSRERLIAAIHALDHLQRLHERCEEDEDRGITATKTPSLSEQCALLVDSNQAVRAAMARNAWREAARTARTTQDAIHEQVRPYRAEVVQQIASGAAAVPAGTASLEALRWLRRVSKHVARVTDYLGQAVAAAGR